MDFGREIQLVISCVRLGCCRSGDTGVALLHTVALLLLRAPMVLLGPAPSAEERYSFRWPAATCHICAIKKKNGVLQSFSV